MVARVLRTRQCPIPNDLVHFWSLEKLEDRKLLFVIEEVVEGAIEICSVVRELRHLLIASESLIRCDAAYNH